MGHPAEEIISVGVSVMSTACTRRPELHPKLLVLKRLPASPFGFPGPFWGVSRPNLRVNPARSVPVISCDDI